MKKSRGALIILLWLASVLPIRSEASGQTSVNPAPVPLPPGVEIRAQAFPTTGTVGDPIRIFVDISMPAGYQAATPRLDKQAGEFTVLDFKPGSTLEENPQSPAKQKTRRLHHRMEILAALYKTGTFTFPSLPIKLKTAEGKEESVASNPVHIEIRSILTAKDAPLKDLKKQAELPDPIRWALWIGLLLAAAIFALILWRIRKRRRADPPKISPIEKQDLLALAEADLRELITRGLPAAGTEKHFYIRLSEIAKRILEYGFGIPSIEQTTEEILRFIHDRPVADAEIAGLISSFLLDCDLVKFAKYVPSRAEQETAIRNALQILERAKTSSQSTVGNQQ